MKETLPALTSFRFFAALAVGFFHIPFTMAKSVGGESWLSWGNLGVNFFFILSGFVLTHVYEGREFNVRQFYERRALRILPLYYLMFFIWCVLYLRHVNSNTIKIGIAHLALLQSFFNGLNYTLNFNPVAWTISVEMFFYALFPFFIVGRRAFYGLVAFSILVLVLPSHLVKENYPIFYTFNPIARLPEFLSGIGGYKYFYKSLKDWEGTQASVLQGLGLCALAISIHLLKSQPDTIVNVWLMIPVLWVISTFSLDSALSRLVANPFFYLCGEISFSFYMIHHTVFKLVDRLFSSGHTSPNLVVLFAMGLSFVLSLLLYNYFEKPIREKGLQWAIR